MFAKKNSFSDVKIIALLPDEEVEKNDVEVGYILIRCNKCKKSWGITPSDSQILSVDLTCRACKLANK